MHRPDSLWASHIPVLVRALQITTGPVLEVGAGMMSTPLLHTMCADQGRKLVSYDNDNRYVDLLRKFRNADHEITLVTDWEEIDEKIKSIDWGIAFIDHKPEGRRNEEIKKLANNAEFIIVHDSNDPAYHYEKIYSLFKYRFDYTKPQQHTMVLSNVREFQYE